jgi:hypothetical protein
MPAPLVRDHPLRSEAVGISLPPTAAPAERTAKNADLLMHPSRAAHRSAWPHDSP